jgi:excisionase family DNA binding protein
MSPQEKPLLTIGDACQFLGLSRSTVYRLVADGELRLIKVYNRSLIARRDLDGYVERLVCPETVNATRTSRLIRLES